MNEEITKIGRKKIGEYLKSLREDKGISTYQMTKSHGIQFALIKAIEEGSTNYTIDSFLTYISALDCYFYLANRDGKHLDHLDMVLKIKNNYQNQTNKKNHGNTEKTVNKSR